MEPAASGLAAPRVALPLWLDFLTDAAGWLVAFLADAAGWLLAFLTDAASWLVAFLADAASWLLAFLTDAASSLVAFLTDAASWLLDFLTDAASWSLNLTIGPPAAVLRRLDVELGSGVKSRLGWERFLCVARAARTLVVLPVSLPCVAILIPKPS